MDAPRRAPSMRLRRPVRRALTIGAVALTVAAALTAWWVVRQREQAVGASVRARQLDASSAVLLSRVASSVSALAGVPAIVTPGGAVDAQAFDSFGQGVLRGTTSTAVAYGLLVPGDQRAAFEATQGFPIVDRTPDGSLIPAPARSRYCPIVAAVTASGAPSPLNGFDICGDPQRVAALDRAAATGDVSVTAPFVAIPSGNQAVSFYRVLRAPAPNGPPDAPLGFASFTTTAENLLADVSGSLPARTSSRLSDGADTLFGPATPFAGPTRSIPVAGRTWTLQLDDRRFASHAGSTALLVIALGLIGLLAALAQRTLRYEARLERLTEAQDRDMRRTAAVAALAQSLSSAEGSADVVTIVERDAGRPLGADGVALATFPRRPGVGASGRDGPDLLDDVAAAGQAETLDEHALADRWPDAAARFGLASVAAVLIVALPRGEARGAIAFAWTQPTRPGQGELDTAATVAELVAAALARSRTIEDSTARAAYEARRAELATALGDETTMAGVARCALDTLGQVLRASCGYLATAEGGHGDLRVQATLPIDADHPDRPLPALTSRPGSVIRWPVDDVLRALASSADGVGALDAAEAVVLPGGTGPVLLVLAWRGPHPSGTGLRDVADVVGQAVVRASAYEREAATATALQDALLAVDGGVTAVVHAARYQAAEAPMVVGGDWYDLVADGSRVVVTVGDVVGRGLAAATVMGQLRSALRAALLADPDLVRALEVVDRFASVMGDECFATVAVAVIDPETGTLTYCHAGHPPVLVVSDEGTTTFAPGARSWPIGVATERRQDLQAGVVPFGPGDLVVLYTDGLVERRHENIDVGLEGLASVAGEWSALPTSMLCDRLLAAVAQPGAGVRDDAVVLVVRRTGAVAGRCFADVLVAEPSSLRPARERLADWLATVPIVGRQLDDVVLAVHEATSNAVEHGRGTARRATVRIEAGVVGAELVVAVSDAGRWREPTSEPEQQDRGRGIALMGQLMDAVTIDTSHQGTTVTMSIVLDRDRAPAT